MSFDWKKAVGTVAPGVANMLGGPLAGMATNALLDMFGIDPGSPAAKDQLQTAVANMTPADAIRMKEIEANLKIELKKVGVDIFKTEVKDRKSARTVHKDSVTPAVLTYLLAACAGVIVFFVFTTNLQGVDKTLVGTVIGYIFSELKQATGFWLGSSFGGRQRSQNMSDEIVKLIK